MGTRADFYVGKGASAEWLGSIAWDGYPEGVSSEVLKAGSEADYREAVKAFFAKRTDVTLPDHGWPWPWNDSGTTDYSYWHHDGKVWGSCFGGGVFPCDQPQPEDDDALGEPPDMPDMSARKNVTLGPRSGVIVVSA